MTKIKKSTLQKDHNKLLNQFAELVRNLKALDVIPQEVCPTFTAKPLQPQQLDQSIFDGLDEIWKFVAVDANGDAYLFGTCPEKDLEMQQWDIHYTQDCSGIDGTFDSTDWKNSLIERDTAKELLEVDLSSELTGSELCRAMLARGDKYISGFGHHQSDDGAVYSTFADTVTRYSHCFHSAQNSWDYFVPINNQGEPLTAKDVGL